MTALKPIENRKVRGVAAEQYPINPICAHPECDKPTESTHHIFPRSLTKSKSFFVAIGKPGDIGLDQNTGEIVLPHAIGLCGSGTTGHHGDLEEHRAWIKLDGAIYIWFDREGEEWLEKGFLNPQPAQAGKLKKKRGPQARTATEKQARKVVSIKVPVGEENVLDDNIEQARERLVESGEAEERGWSDDPPTYYVVNAALEHYLGLV